MKFPYKLIYSTGVKYADSKLFRIRMNPEHKGNKALLEHEKVHVKQWYYTLIPFMVIAALSWFFYREDVGLVLAILGFVGKDLAYTLFPIARRKLELAAYRKQLEVAGYHHLDELARAYSDNYGVTYDKAVSLLSK